MKKRLYVDWPFNINRMQGQTRILYVFGHSLGITDGDIIERFVKAPNMKTVIYYHDEDHLDLAVTNLTAIIGKDEMIERTGGAKHSLELRSQKELELGIVS